MRQKGFIPIIVLFLVIALGAGVYFIYSSQKDKIYLDENQTEDTPTVSPTTNGTIAPSPVTNGKTSLPMPTTKLSPMPIVNNNFTCGTYDSTTRPPQPPRGLPPLYATLYTSGGTSQGHTLKGFQWDYNGDGIWDTGTNVQVSNNYNPKEYSYIYTKNGTYKPKFRPIATSGQVGPTCNYPFDVVVGGKPEFENDTIAVDKLSIEIAISKSNHSYPLKWHEKPVYANGGDLIYSPGFNVSSKENFTYVSFKEPWNSNYGIHETGLNLNAGTSDDFHLFIWKNTPNGVYQVSKTITYTTGDRGTVTKDGPVVNFKITITD